MIEAGFKDEFDALVRNAGLEEFLSDKCEQYAMLTASFVRRFKFLAGRESSILFDLYDKSYTMDVEDFNRICQRRGRRSEAAKDSLESGSLL